MSGRAASVVAFARARVLARVASFCALLAASTAVLQACSSSANDGATAHADGGEDATAARGEAPEAGEGVLSCDTTTDLFAKVHDASIGDGRATTGVCLGCAKAQCALAITTCTEDCPCQAIVGSALECYLTTKQIGCAASLTNIFVTKETRRDALSLLGCVESECPVECAVDGVGRVDAGADTDAREPADAAR